MSTKINVEFPCGYKMEFYQSTIWGIDITIFDSFESCPLHGKNCMKVR